MPSIAKMSWSTAARITVELPEALTACFRRNLGDGSPEDGERNVHERKSTRGVEERQ